MYLNLTYLDALSTVNNSQSVIIQMIIAAVILFCPAVFAQWVNNPSINTKLVSNVINPINISSVEDKKGGAFVFWEDNKSSFQNDIYFIHVDGNGKISFRADGKKVSEFPGVKVNPVSSAYLPGSALILWKDFSRSKTGDLFIQRVLFNGSLLWTNTGVQITSSQIDHSGKEVEDYSLSVNNLGNAFTAYILKEADIGKESRICLQKISASGKLMFPSDSLVIHKSMFKKTSPAVVPDDNGGAAVFWIEYQNNKSSIFIHKVDSLGKIIQRKKPLMISGINDNIISFSVQPIGNGSIYIAWQVQKPEKEIRHQLISNDGKLLWGTGGKSSTTMKGSQLNPQVLISDSSIILSWVNEFNKDRDIYTQKYNLNGKALWKEKGIPVIEYDGDQFGQKIISDGKSGAIITWFDRRIDTIKANIYSQRISASGVLLWNQTGVETAVNYNTEKSYLNIVSDQRGGVISVFKNNRVGKGEIYAQKIFNSGTYVSQIIGLNAERASDSVKVSWYSANETEAVEYDIERTFNSDTSISKWAVIGTVASNDQSGIKYYEFFDKPEESGTLYYRVVQRDFSGNFQPSDVIRINYFDSANNITVAQNIPNPFNGSTIISFYLPAASEVKIEFFNSQVEKISEVKQKFPAGENEITFSSNDLPTGIYFYRFQVKDFVDVKKMVVSD